MENHWKQPLKGDPTAWLLGSNPWTVYQTMQHLVHTEDAVFADAKRHLLADVRIQHLIQEAARWFEVPPKRHDDAKMSHYQLKMLADFGLTVADPVIADIVEMAKSHMDQDYFAIKQALPERGSEVILDDSFDQWHALPCDAPVILTTLYRLGDRSESLMKAISAMQKAWLEPSGWFCHLFFVDSQFKKHGAGCMMAGLMALELFSLLPDVDSKSIEHAFSTLVYHKDFGKSLYYFGRSKKFFTYKYPYVWYNALYMADVVSRYPQFRETDLMKELMTWLLDGQDEAGRYKPTSMFMHYKGWDFANKKEVSPWLTFLVCKILKQYYQ